MGGGLFALVGWWGAAESPLLRPTTVALPFGGVPSIENESWCAMSAPTEPSTMISRLRKLADAGNPDARRIVDAVDARDGVKARAGDDDEPARKRVGRPPAAVEDKMAGAGL